VIPIAVQIVTAAPTVAQTATVDAIAAVNAVNTKENQSRLNTGIDSFSINYFSVLKDC
jgi:hypothetical protein